MNMTFGSAAFRFKLLLSLVVLWPSSYALANVALSKVVPLANAKLDSTPTELIIEYEKPVALTKLTLTDNDKNTDINFNFKADSKLTDKYKFPLPKLNGGEYMVSWTAMDNDLHSKSGAFLFTVKATTLATAKAADAKTKH